VSCRGTIAAIFGITNEFAALQLQYVYSADITTTTTVRGGEGSRHWNLAIQSKFLEKFRHHNYSMCTNSTDNMNTTKAKGVGIGVSRRDKRRDSLHYDINQIYGWRRQYVYRSNITISPDNDGVFDRIESYDDDVRGFSPQNLMISSSYLILFILLFVCTVVCIFACMYYNIAVVCLCWREVC